MVYFRAHFANCNFFQDVINGLCFSDKPVKSSSAIKATDIPANSQLIQLTATPQEDISRVPSTNENKSELILYCIACCAFCINFKFARCR